MKKVYMYLGREIFFLAGDLWLPIEMPKCLGYYVFTANGSDTKYLGFPHQAILQFSVDSNGAILQFTSI